MKLHRFIDPEFRLSDRHINIDNSEIVHQIAHVLRMKTGENIILCNGEGKEALVEITDIQKTKIQVVVKEKFKSIPEPERKVTLYAAVIKGEHFEMIVEKATEMGVSEIIPIITHRTIKLNLKMDRMYKIIREAAEQSGRGVVPEIWEPISFKEALNRAKAHDKNFFCDFNSPTLSPEMLKDISSVSCFIGPEGGWDDSEREMAKKESFTFISLSNFIFRAETAAITATYLLV